MSDPIEGLVARDLSRSGREVGTGTINVKKLIRLKFQKGWTNEQIGEYFGVSRQAVGQCIRRLNVESISHLYSRGQDFADQQLNAQALIVGLMSDAAKLLQILKDSTEKTDDDDLWSREDIEKRKLMLAAMAEIRAQVTLYASMADKLFSHEAHADFQRIVVETIESVDPEVAQKIKIRLARSQPLREFIGTARRAS